MEVLYCLCPPVEALPSSVLLLMEAVREEEDVNVASLTFVTRSGQRLEEKQEDHWEGAELMPGEGQRRD